MISLLSSFAVLVIGYLLYGKVVESLRGHLGADRVGTGVFQTHMEVALVNDGPVTIILDTSAGQPK